MPDSLLHQIAITKIPKVGAMTAKNLISYCGGTSKVFEADKKTLLKVPGVGEHIAQCILQQNVLGEAEKEVEFIQRNKIKALFYTEKEYPARLRKLNDCPLMLFYKGTSNLNNARIVGVVGTRKPTHHGISICEEIVEGLRPYNVIILSGLAYGIDVTAHKTALATGQETIGVLGHGLGSIYPAAHRKVSQDMTLQGGLLTEFTSNSGPDREHFPMRNRIVAGLCDALVVVETAERGGSMITAVRAAQYNKQLFAVPGRIRDKLSIGCNQLIKQNKATLLESAEELAYTMHWQLAEEESELMIKQTQLFQELTEPEKKIIDLLSQKDENQFDIVLRQAEMSSGELSAMLLTLEFQGLVKSLPGKRFALA